MEESGPHKQSILRNKEVSLKNAPRKPRDVTRPTVMIKRLGFRGTLPVKYKIDFWNNPITASILVWNQVVLNQSQQLGYLNSKLMLSWDCPFKCRSNHVHGKGNAIKRYIRYKTWPEETGGYNIHRMWEMDVEWGITGNSAALAAIFSITIWQSAEERINALRAYGWLVVNPRP